MSKLVERYLRILAPKVESRFITHTGEVEIYYESIIERYMRIMKLLDGDTNAIKKHREELFGTESNYIYPDNYSMIGLGKELVGSYPRFKEMLDDPKQVQLAAQMIAQYRLEKMVELVQRHEGIVKRNREKMEKKGAKK